MFDSDVDDEYIREYAFEPELLINRDDYLKREEQKEKEQREAIKRRSSLRRKSQRKASVDSYDAGGQQKNQIDVEIEAFYYMYGRYTKDLGEFAKDEARKLKLLEKRRKQEDRQRNKWWEIFTGITGQTFIAYAKSLIMDMETYVCTPRRGLGVLSIVRRYNGICIICGGQRHQCLYKCTCLAVPRSHITADHTVFSVGLITGLFNTFLSWFCTSGGATKYRFGHT
uniref:Chloride channel protein 2 n=1 Tax=Ceratitis capitata TaxID=7213 RepID=W8BCW6_CERCA